MGIRGIIAAAALLAGVVPATGLTTAEHRIALVIGNGRYPEAPLANPQADARAMADALRKLSFDVVEVDDGTREQMMNAAATVQRMLYEHPGTVLVYYAGHGVQLDWVNYMIPVDAHLQSASDAAARAISVTRVLTGLKQAGARTTLIILDACRDNPFEDHASGKGLAGMDAPTGTLLAYATAPGNVASDGDGAHGLYTGHLLDEIADPGVKIEDIFKRVRLAVRVQSKGAQIPWESTSLEDDFYFSPPAKAVEHSADADAKELDLEMSAWEKIKDSSNADDYVGYLNHFPSGFFAEAAQFRLDHLSAPKVVAQQAPVAILGTAGRVAAPEAVQPLASGENRYHVGDMRQWVTTDLWTGEKTEHISKVTFADDKKVVLGNNVTVLDQMGNVYKNRDGRREPFINETPADLAPGKTWRSAFRSPDSGNNPSYYDFKVVGLEEVTVPAGTFLAYRIDGTGYTDSGYGNHPRRAGDGTLFLQRWIDPKTYLAVKVIRKIGPPNQPKVWEMEELVKFTPGPR